MRRPNVDDVYLNNVNEIEKTISKVLFCSQTPSLKRCDKERELLLLQRSPSVTAPNTLCVLHFFRFLKFIIDKNSFNKCN